MSDSAFVENAELLVEGFTRSPYIVRQPASVTRIKEQSEFKGGLDLRKLLANMRQDGLEEDFSPFFRQSPLEARLVVDTVAVHQTDLTTENQLAFVKQGPISIGDVREELVDGAATAFQVCVSSDHDTALAVEKACKVG